MKIVGRKWMWAGWLVVAALGCGRSWAQAGTTTTVQDTITDASGTPLTGTVVVSWAAFTTAAGATVAAGSLSATLGAGGALSVALLPNAGATPMGSYYTAVYHLSDGTTSREFWVVPVVSSASGTGTVKLAGIRNQVLPASMAMQTVSKGYVDTTVAKAMAGVTPNGNLPFVLKSGDTMAGALLLAGDPAQPLQAADKHYVDAAMAGVLPTGSAGGDLGGTYPDPTVAAVHAVSGTLDGVTVGAATPAAGQFTGLTLADASTPVTLQVTHPQSSITQLQASVSSGNQMKLGIFGGGYSGFQFGSLNDFGQIVYNNAGESIVGYVQGGTAAFTANAISFTAPQFHETLMTPASSSASCDAGDFTDDANFHYVCVAASTWKRVALSSF